MLHFNVGNFKNAKDIIENITSSFTGKNDLPTPELIEKAYEKREINLEQKWLYLVYAFYDYEKLPSKFKSNVGWHGTSYLEDIHDFIQTKGVCQFSQETIKKIETYLNQKLNCY